MILSHNNNPTAHTKLQFLRALHVAVTVPPGAAADEDAAAAGLSAPAALLAERAPRYAAHTQSMLHRSVAGAFAATGSLCGGLDLATGACRWLCVCACVTDCGRRERMHAPPMHALHMQLFGPPPALTAFHHAHTHCHANTLHTPQTAHSTCLKAVLAYAGRFDLSAAIFGVDHSGGAGGAAPAAPAAAAGSADAARLRLLRAPYLQHYVLSCAAAARMAGALPPVAAGMVPVPVLPHPQDAAAAGFFGALAAGCGGGGVVAPQSQSQSQPQPLLQLPAAAQPSPAAHAVLHQQW